MSQDSGAYQPPDPIKMPPMYAWPPRPIESVVWLIQSFLYPWGFFFIGLAIVTWKYLTPSMETMATLEPGWIALIWLRNAGLLTIVAGSLHWRLYIRKSQDKRFKFDSRWPTRNSKQFTFGDQVTDNMFWSLASGCTMWTSYEALTLWAYASGILQTISWIDAPIYLSIMMLAVFFWSTLHFEFAHRPLHWPPLYKVAHALHHRNVNTGPWTGISMHPIEHLFYFSQFLLWWVIPVHPVVIILSGLYQGISPAISHCGFEKVELSKNMNWASGTHFHTLHHQHFEVNYGNLLTPTDKLFNTWHDGTPAAQAALVHRRRERHEIEA